MNRLYTTIILAAILLGCSSSKVDVPPPVAPPVVPTVPDGAEWEKYVPSYPNESGENILLEANSAKDVYALIDATGFNSVESPDRNNGNHGYDKQIRHITQAKDNYLQKEVFLFHIHALDDKDRDQIQIKDRQRNEIKTDAKSPENMKGHYGERHHYRWKFCLPADFQPTTNFTHIHQLKGVGNTNVDQPIITLTARYNAKGSEMQLLHNKSDNDGSPTYLLKVPLADFLGNWVIVDEWATFTENGQYTFSIVSLKDGKTLMYYSTKELHLFREGSEFTRPKYGIYRSIKESTPWIKDEIVKFADFELREIK